MRELSTFIGGFRTGGVLLCLAFLQTAFAHELSVLRTPAPGSTLTSSNVTLTWSPGISIVQYWLNVGTTGVGSFDILGENQETRTSRTMSGLPTDGRKLYVRVFSFSDRWEFLDYQLTACSNCADGRAVIATPPPGSALPASTITLTWNAAPAAAQYWLNVGFTGAGAFELFGGDAGTTLSKTLSNLPADGRPLYVRLFTRFGSTWVSNDYQYRAFDINAAALTSPAQGLSLSSSSVTFNWSAGTNVSQYWVNLGTTGVGSFNIFGGDMGANLSQTFSGLPVDGIPLYFRIFSRIGTVWHYNDYQFTACSNCPDPRAQIISPVPGSIFTSSSVTFTWSPGIGASQYWMNVGSSEGAFDIFGGDLGTSLSRTITGIPTDGREIHILLFTRFGNVWQSVDVDFEACNGCPGSRAQLTSPAPGSKLTSMSPTFTWTAGIGAAQYWLNVGFTGVGSFELFGGDVGTSLTKTVTNVPADGRTIYIRLFSRTGSLWQFSDYQVTATGP